MLKTKLLLTFFIFSTLPSLQMTYAQTTDTIRYIPIGDSYTIGEGVLEHERWPNLLVKKLNKENIPIQLISNPAQSGWTTKDALENELPIFTKSKANFSTLLIGANDCFQGASESDFRKNLSLLIDGMQKNLSNKSCLLLVNIPDFSLTPFGKAYTNDRNASQGLGNFNEIIEDEGRKRGLAVVDIFEISKLVKDDASLIAADGLHPSAKQYELWLEKIFPAALKILAESKKCFAPL